MMTTVSVVAVAVIGLVVVGLILKRTARAATVAALALLLALVGYYVWPTLYRFYTPVHRAPGVIEYRENRFTGTVDVLTRRGWVRIARTESEGLLEELRRGISRVRDSANGATGRRD